MIFSKYAVDVLELDHLLELSVVYVDVGLRWCYQPHNTTSSSDTSGVIRLLTLESKVDSPLNDFDSRTLKVYCLHFLSMLSASYVVYWRNSFACI